MIRCRIGSSCWRDSGRLLSSLVSTQSNAFSQRVKRSPFQYTKIGSHEIRLLKRSSALEDGRLQYSLQTFGLGNAPPYTALSYTWGEQPPSKNITLNRQHFAVRPPLWSALKHLNRQAPWDFVWVDAVSINQQDVQERNEQVQVMDRIFRNAETVTAWLGIPSDHNHEDASNGGNWSLAENFVDIANRAYWSRAWIIQELLVAQDVQLMVGQHSFDFEYLKSLVSTESDQFPKSSRAKTLLEMEPFIHSRDGDRFPHWRQPLRKLLVDFRYSECKDPRDKVFSLLNLVPDHEQEILRRFFPDYSMTVEAVFAITLAFLRNAGAQKITAQSDDIFTAFGVAGRQERDKLIAISHDLDSKFAGVGLKNEH